MGFAWRTAGCAAALGLALAGKAAGVESPRSTGPVSLIDNPIFRIPMMADPPTIDGVFEAKEWADASGLTGLWYDTGGGHFHDLASHKTQAAVYAGYDRRRIYLCYRSRVYPEGAWLKARGRFPDVTMHPQYGLLLDDHVELELRPVANVALGYRLGLFKWIANPIATFSDQLWSVTGGEGKQFTSQARAASTTDETWWTFEIAIPMASLRHLKYAGKDAEGRPLVKLPPPDGTVWRSWFTRSLGPTGPPYFNAYDKHPWNTTKNRIIFDSRCVSVQVNKLGRLMADEIDVDLTLRNHNVRSETVRVGFFVETAEGPVYTSYDDDQTREGLIELVPGETKRLRFRKRFPGITPQGNYTWFDVRSAGRPAKVLLQTRLVRFHSENLPGFREKYIDPIATARPPRRDFSFRYAYSPYTNRLSAVVDKGIHGASDDARSAVTARLTLLAAIDDRPVGTWTVPFVNDLAMLLKELPPLKTGRYRVALLLFDEHERIVGERNPAPPFYKGEFPWEHNDRGLSDTVWGPYVPIRVTPEGFETLKHRFRLAPSGLPAQIEIQPDVRELPLERRAAPEQATAEELAHVGRGKQLRAPMRLEAVVAGRRVAAEVVEPAKLIRRGRSEVHYGSRLRVGPVDVRLHLQYDCDGALRARLTWGAAPPAEVERLELVTEVAGVVDMGFGEQSVRWGGMHPTPMEVALPMTEGVVWDSADCQTADLYYSRFVPWFVFGSADRVFVWVCDSDRPWLIDRDGSTMTLQRGRDRQVTWRVKFVNHKAEVAGRRTITFDLFLLPARPRPEGCRRLAWFRETKWGGMFGYPFVSKRPKAPVVSSDLFDGPRPMRPYLQHCTAGYDLPAIHKNAYTGEWKGGHQLLGPTGAGHLEYSPSRTDLFAWHLSEYITLGKGRWQGWWWDEQFGPFRRYSLAGGGAYRRDPNAVGDRELPYQSTWGTLLERDLMKRLARVFCEAGAENRQFLWSNNSATALGSYAGDAQLIEDAAAYHRSYDISNVVQFPIECFRYCARPFSGVLTRITPMAVVAAGDDPSRDRQIVGRALLHDIGVSTAARVANLDQARRIQNVLHAFGYFEPAGTERVPYWRNGRIVRFGEAMSYDEAMARRRDPLVVTDAKVHVTAYRRRRADGGIKVLMVVMNENDVPIRGRLHVLDPRRLFGGENTLTMRAALGEMRLPAGAADALKAALDEMADAGVVLKDLETGGVVRRQAGGGGRAETYGTLFVPAQDYRVLYGEHARRREGER
jgi:hypothetical protein